MDEKLGRADRWWYSSPSEYGFTSISEKRGIYIQSFWHILDEAVKELAGEVESTLGKYGYSHIYIGGLIDELKRGVNEELVKEYQSKMERGHNLKEFIRRIEEQRKNENINKLWHDA